MRDFRVAAAQFESRIMNMDANFKTVAGLTKRAVDGGAELICFHEQSLAGHNLWEAKAPAPDLPAGDEGRKSPNWKLPGAMPVEFAQPVPDGPLTRNLEDLAAQHRVTIVAGLPELSRDELCYNTTVLVGPEGYIGKYRKTHLLPGSECGYFRPGGGFPVFDLGLCRAGCLIGYDNHFPEAHRILALHGAQLILMPHASVDRGWWPDLQSEEALEQAKNWILTWLRARAFDNSAYVVFVNQACESGEGALGCSMILDPDGHVIAQAYTTGQEVIFADIKADIYHRVRHRSHDYMRHRRPALYGPLSEQSPDD